MKEILEINTPADGKSDAFIQRNNPVHLSELRYIMGGGDLIAMPEMAFEELENDDCCEYGVFVVKASGENYAEQCYCKMQEIGCFKYPLCYKARIWIHPETTIAYSSICEIWQRFRRIPHPRWEGCFTMPHLYHFAVGFDAELQKDEMRMMIVRYYWERWPREAEYNWSQAICHSSYEKTVECFRNLNHFFRTPPFLYYKDYTSYLRKEYTSNPMPANYKFPIGWENEEKKYEFLQSIGLNPYDSIVKTLDNMTCSKRKLGFDSMRLIKKKIVWLFLAGSDVNAVFKGKTPLDIIENGNIPITDKASSVLYEIKTYITNAGAKRASDISVNGKDLVLLEYKKREINYQKLSKLFNVHYDF